MWGRVVPGEALSFRARQAGDGFIYSRGVLSHRGLEGEALPVVHAHKGDRCYYIVRVPTSWGIVYWRRKEKS